MMTWLATSLFFFTSIALGTRLLSWSKVSLESPLIRLLSGCSLGLGVLTWLLFWLSWLTNFSLGGVIIGISCLLLVSLPYRHLEKLRPQIETVIRDLWPQIVILIGVTCSLTWFWSRMLFIDSQGLQAGWRTVWGDWAVHLSYATSFAYGDNFPPEFPIFSSQRLAYPFLSDFLSGVLLKLGQPLVNAFILPSILFSLALIYGLFHWAKTLFSWRTAVVSLFLFIAGGGLGYWLLTPRAEWGVLSQQSLEYEYTYQPDTLHIYWINKVTSELIPQRGLLMALPLAMLGYTLCWHLLNLDRLVPPSTKQKKATIGQRLPHAIGLGTLLIIILPLIHAHTFVAVLGMFGWTFLLRVGGLKMTWRELNYWLIGLGLILVLAGGQLYYFFSQNAGQAGFLKWQWGWMVHHDPNSSLWWFWVKNVGIALPLSVLGYLLSPAKHKAFLFGFWLIFFAGNLALFQPYEYDNTKAFTHWYLGAVISAGYVIDRLSRAKSSGIQIAALGLVGFVVVANLSGILDIAKAIDSSYRPLEMASSYDLKLAQWFRANTPPDAVVITGQRHTHWVPMLSGRKIILGFVGWLWSYNLDYAPRQFDSVTIYRGGTSALRLIEKYDIDYIVIGPDERASYLVDLTWFAQTFPQVYTDQNYSIFKVE